MAARDTLIERAAPFLEDGEVVEHAFRARALVPSTDLAEAKATYVVIGTQRAVLILRTSPWSTKAPKTLVARVPRGTPMSFRKGSALSWSRLEIGDYELRVGGIWTLREAERFVATAEAPAP
jgi:hypothetical protein